MMAFWSGWFRSKSSPAPRAAVQDAGGGTVITSPEQLEEALRTGSVSASGIAVNTNSAMRSAAVFACVRLLAGVPANMPVDIKRRVDEKTRSDATDHALWKLFRRRPNRWQTPSQFKRMMTAHLKLRGNAYARIVRSRNQVIELIPLHPDRVEPRQRDDLVLEYVYTRRNGGKVTLKQDEVFHLVGLSLDGITGVSVLTYARESIELALAEQRHGSVSFKNGASVSTVLSHPKRIGKEGLEFLRESLEQYRSGGEREGNALILEEGMTVDKLGMTAADAQWIESRKFSRSDIAMFFGVPPHMIGDTEKSTSWGTGLEQQKDGFLVFSAEDDLITWEETINRDLISDAEAAIYARFNRNALVRGDLKARTSYYVQMRQWGVFSPDEIRALEDMNPRPDGRGGEYAEPPNTAGGAAAKLEDERDDPPPNS